jgi:hypothetical protein
MHRTMARPRGGDGSAAPNGGDSTRRTKAQMGQLARQIIDVLASDHPQSVRHIFYRMTDPRLPEPVEKSESGYTTVQRLLVKLRREGRIPYGWITDATRRGYFTDTWDTPAEAVEQIAGLYRRSYWATAPCYLEVWVESRSIAGVIQDDCERHAVPLYPAGGFTSLSLAFEAAEHMKRAALWRPIHVLYIGDYDPAGVLIDRQVETELRQHLDEDHELHFHRIGVTAEQVALMSLPTKPAKERRGGFTGGTVEAEALPAGAMRELLNDAIEQFVDPHQLRVLQVAEEEERHALKLLAADMWAYEARL